MRTGRPIEYNEEYVVKAKKYLQSCIDDIEKKVVKIPSKGGLAIALGIARDTLYDWAEKYEDFSDIMEAMGAIQEERLLNNGLSGVYNPTIAKVLLTKHGYRDATDSDLNVKGNINLSELFDKAKDVKK